MDGIRNALKPLKRKLTLEKGVNILIISVSAAFVLIAFLLLVSKFIYIENSAALAAAALLLAFAVTLIFLIVTMPDYAYTAAVCDSLGYKQRFVTAWEIVNGDKITFAAGKVVEDALNLSKKSDFVNEYKFSVKRVRLILLALAVMLFCGFLPVSDSQRINEQKKAAEAVDEKLKAVSQGEEELLAAANESQKAEIKEVTKALKKDIKAAKTEAEVIKAAKSAQEKLMKLSKESVNGDLKKLGQSLKNHESTKALGEAIESGDYSDISKMLDELNDFLETASEEDLEALSDIINQAAKDIEANEELKNNLNQLSAALGNGNLSEIASSLSEFNNKINALANENAALRDAVNKYNESLGQNGQTGEQSAQSGQQGQSGLQSQSGQQGQSGLQSQSGESGSEAEGSGEGQSQQGSGRGQGNNGQPGGSGQGTGTKANENIYRRDAEGKADSEFSISGSQSEEGVVSEQEVKRLGEAGESVPYDAVFGEYKSEALNALDDYSIPYGLKEIVRDYFTSLE